MEKSQKLEIAKSFGQTVQIEQFQPRNFFCSAKAEVELKDFEKMSEQLYLICKESVERDIASYKKEKEEEQTVRFEEPSRLAKNWKRKPSDKNDDNLWEKEADAQNLMDAKRGD